MDYKKEFQRLVELIKTNAKKEGVKIRNEDIAERMDKGRTYISDLLSPNGKPVTKKHVDDIKIRFADELRGVFKPSASSDPLNRERAIIKALTQRLAKLESKVYNRPVEDCLAELDQDTKIALMDLERED